MAKVGEILKYKDGGLSVEEAKKRMFEANEQPAKKPIVGFGAPAIDVLEPELPEVPETPVIPEETIPVSKPAVTVAPGLPKVLESPKPPEVQKIETEQFVGEIKQEEGQWVAELRYRLGEGLAPGVERFVAATKNDLMLELLKGKGHATLRVKQAVRREKLGREVDRAYALPPKMTTEAFQNLPVEAQESMLDSIAAQQAYEFRSLHPEFVQTESNGKSLIKFLAEQNLPVTVKNLEYAFEDLSESGVLDRVPVAPEKKPVEPSLAQPATPTTRGDSPSTPEATPSAVASPPQAAPPVQAIVVRKRGSSGLTPGSSSVPGTLTGPEDGEGSKVPSEAELRKLPLPELKRIADADRRKRAATQR